MKVLLCILIAFFITGCCDDNSTKEERTRKKLQTVSILNSARMPYIVGSLNTCEYEGHKYVVYNYDRGCGIVHHPDCNCKERKNEK